jgi:uncharacterized protein (DUF4415 family)
MSKLSGSSRLEKQPASKPQDTTAALKAELDKLRQVDDADIDLSEIPEQLDWANAQIGKYYRPIKEPVSLRLDADVLDWFRSFGKGYQSKMNEVLRVYYCSHCGKPSQQSKGAKSAEKEMANHDKIKGNEVRKQKRRSG